MNIFLSNHKGCSKDDIFQIEIVVYICSVYAWYDNLFSKTFILCYEIFRKTKLIENYVSASPLYQNKLYCSK